MDDDDQDEFDALLVSEADKYKPLIERHPIPELDGRVVFNGADGKHEYRVDGLLAPRSGTAIIKASFPAFLPRQCVNKFFGNWLKNGNKYADEIENAETEADAMRAIAALWDKKGSESRIRGTALHKRIEDDLNGVPLLFRIEPAGECAQAYYAFETWIRHGWPAQRRLRPYRTELPVCWMSETPDENGVLRPVLAGMIDAVFVDEEGNYTLIDWKRSKPFGPWERAFDERSGYGPASTLPDTTYAHYALQLALYARMLKKCAGIDVGKRRFLVRFPSDVDPSQAVDAETIDAVEMSTVDIVAEELLARLARDEPVVRDDEKPANVEDDPEVLWLDPELNCPKAFKAKKAKFAAMRAARGK